MSYSNSTTNYGLPLPDDSDRSNWTDNNTAFELIDNAIHQNAVATVSFSAALGALTARVAALENAQPQSLSGFVKYDANASAGLTNSQYGKLVIQQ